MKKPFKCCCQYLNCFPLLTADQEEPKADWRRIYLIVVFPSLEVWSPAAALNFGAFQRLIEVVVLTGELDF
ncbi:hypothetical protein H6F83_24550 [Coleofasciculus sp. FACHB-125]|uniref:hypothetical protein n=1 Tax=Coleofasciculus sp. FACHB-125 TaxID=2692784 RepID=UPI00168689ED|nr:hypothetical protein [Coleofasciculus sp. FACHB-125]MBD1903079.1 hypothetical protein [Coleofasciculus sp. FACHB-125]